MIPVYVVGGFLDSGKTYFLNTLIKQGEFAANALVIQFERGEEALAESYGKVFSVAFSKRELDKGKDFSEEIAAKIAEVCPAEIWVEWNGMAEFSKLMAIFNSKALSRLCKIETIIDIADSKNIDELIGKTGAAVLEFIQNSDFAIVKNADSSGGFLRVRRALKNLNSGLHVVNLKSYDGLYGRFTRERLSPINLFLASILFIVILYIFAIPLLENAGIPAGSVITAFLGIILQALPFMLIGVLLSSAIQVLVPSGFIERRFPKSLWLGIPFAVISGFFLPVCDCASVPVFRGLIKRGVPLSAAVTFMLATPVINPVVILSTYYAFGGDWGVVFSRAGLGLLAAVIIGLSFALFPPKKSILANGGTDKIMCACGNFGDSEIKGFGAKLSLFVRHSQAEFFDVGKHLLIGAFIASIFQIMGNKLFQNASSASSLLISTAVMMLIAFALSLCSSSDAVIGKSFAARFPAGAIMGFLIFGPMMDIKNVAMLKAGFTKRFIARLVFMTFAVCLAVVLVYYGIFG